MQDTLGKPLEGSWMLSLYLTDLHLGWTIACNETSTHAHQGKETSLGVLQPREGAIGSLRKTVLNWISCHPFKTAQQTANEIHELTGNMAPSPHWHHPPCCPSPPLPLWVTAESPRYSLTLFCSHLCPQVPAEFSGPVARAFLID